MASNVDISRWIDAAWCPDPYSDAEMQLPYKLIDRDGQLTIVVKRKKKLRIVAELPPFVSNMDGLKHLVEAGAYADVAVLGSDRGKKRILVGIYIDEEDVAKCSAKLKQIKAHAHNIRKEEQHRIEQEQERKVEKKYRRQRRRKAAALWVGRSIAFVTKRAWAWLADLPKNIRRLWGRLVSWTNK